MTVDNLAESETSGNQVIAIKNITKYLSVIAKMRQECPDEGDGQRFFFRGIKDCVYKVQPTIFRENLLDKEAKMGHLAYAKRPFEFREYDGAFERLTKLQHYGLSTRLLDVTLNPLVALYFACENCNNSHYITNKNETEQDQIPDGIIYWCREYYQLHDTTKVKILSAISEMEFDAKITVETCFQKLVDLHIIPKDEIKTLEKNNYEKFGDILQSSYFVIPNFSNDRLIYQSGAFLLAGCINIIENADDVGKSTIQKATTSLQSKFSSTKFIIPGDCKEKILDELDMYNINKSSLFPELEHQMDYITSQSKKYFKRDPVVFSKIKWPSGNGSDNEYQEKPEKKNRETSLLINNDERTKQKIRSTVEKWTPPDISTEVVFKIFEENLVVDWYKKEQVISKIRTKINHSIRNSKKYPAESSKKWANIIVNMVISELKEWLKIEEKSA